MDISAIFLKGYGTVRLILLIQLICNFKKKSHSTINHPIQSICFSPELKIILFYLVFLLFSHLA